jgi:hypothetical protein
MPRSKFDKIALPVAAVLNPFIEGGVNAYILDSLVKYIEPDSKDANTIYQVGFGIAFCASAIQSMAVLHYQNEKDKRELQQHLQIHQEHHHGCMHKTEHFLMHFLGMYLYNFAFGIAGIYFALLEEETPESDEVRMKATAIIAVASLIYTYIQVKLHEIFLDDAEHEHGSMWSAMYDQLVIQVCRGDKTWLQKLKQFWMSWGGLGSHGLAGYFGIKEAINALGLLFWGKRPPALMRDLIAAGLGGVGAIMHTGSELTAVAKSRGISQTYHDIQMFDVKTQKYIMMFFLFACILLTLYHIAPESISVNAETTAKNASTGERALRAAGFGIAFGVPDMVMSMAMTTEGALNFVKGKLNINTHTHSGSCSHSHQKKDTVSLNGDHEDEEEKMPLMNPSLPDNNVNNNSDDSKNKKSFCCC